MTTKAIIGKPTIDHSLDLLVNNEAEAPTLISQKAILATRAAGLNPNAFDPVTIINIITMLFQALSKCGGIISPTPAYIHRSITNPGPFQKRRMRDVIREEVDNPALWGHVEKGILAVGRSSTVDETSTMFSEAVGTPPA